MLVCYHELLPSGLTVLRGQVMPLYCQEYGK